MPSATLQLALNSGAFFMTVTEISIDSLVADPQVHGRVKLHRGSIARYAEAARDPAAREAFPPVVAYRDENDLLWMADGFLRCRAWEKAGHKTIPVDVREGTRRDAILHSSGANCEHGQPRSRRDKWRMVSTILAGPDTQDLAAESDEKLAEL